MGNLFIHLINNGTPTHAVNNIPIILKYNIGAIDKTITDGTINNTNIHDAIIVSLVLIFIVFGCYLVALNNCICALFNSISSWGAFDFNNSFT